VQLPALLLLLSLFVIRHTLASCFGLGTATPALDLRLVRDQACLFCCLNLDVK
jgi:hypothetical protein